MKLSIINKKEWIKEQVDILKSAWETDPISFSSKEEIELWLDKTDLIQILTENFDYEAELSQTQDFTNEEFAKQFIELFQKLKNEIIDRFYKETLKLET
ncbi:MAG TPA: hypothetical protein PLL26_02735 [Candidatus Dojkabacteria bacterium]|nr:hypothetical protein [Candidatus Dojkabacteria bacterium]